ncbi:4-phosphoerythronate dehydrogenase PdxB [Amphritea japonica]|uniref:Erythronate-4-phosphate dehydrogenase n=1 Tax=Amphritea japonica ATCC BAA-1530 TaxID=1278309 RepID=A0A7R6STC9_9GAMM|nr:4-phosphoerythronate dehydrogenase PdxB [Amphritea japonica]BBB26477.1 erythronate-4-phosphate dehydrogenase [Amphritea japonica ATCC BAA-1530]
MKLTNLNIVADENIPALDRLFGHFGKITRLPGRTIQNSDLQEADLLLVRSVTQVSEQLIATSPVHFVGTATIGTDHIDKAALKNREIGFSSAPGCNADAVAEYVVSNLLLIASEKGFKLKDQTVGIVGVGNVGRRLQQRLEALGIKLLLNDPPREAAGDQGFVQLESLLQQADIICLHTPLIKEGRYPSYHLLNAENLPMVKPDSIVLNAGRGPVIDNVALLDWHRKRPDVTLLLDVWEEEPKVDPQLAQQVRIGTPHIAGYSLDGKIRGTWMLYTAFCQHVGIQPEIELADCLAEADSPLQIVLDGSEDLATIVHRVYQPEADHQRFIDSLIDTGSQPQRFDLLRKRYPVRRECAAAKLQGVKPDKALADQLKAVGFILE